MTPTQLASSEVGYIAVTEALERLNQGYIA